MEADLFGKEKKKIGESLFFTVHNNYENDKQALEQNCWTHGDDFYIGRLPIHLLANVSH